MLRSGWITTGPKCRELEARLSERYGGRPVRLAASATGALEYALRVAGVGPGDEVITTPLSWVATANVVLTVGAQPVFVDVDPRTRNIDLDRVERAITSKTSAMIPVDLADAKAINKATETIRKTNPVINGLINNAGYARPGYFHELPADEFEKAMRVDYLGAVHMTRALHDLIPVRSSTERAISPPERLRLRPSSNACAAPVS